MKKCILINSPIFWDAAAEGENYLSPLGLGYIATYVEKAGIQVEILDAVKQRKSVEDIVKYIQNYEMESNCIVENIAFLPDEHPVYKYTNEIANWGYGGEMASRSILVDWSNIQLFNFYSGNNYNKSFDNVKDYVSEKKNYEYFSPNEQIYIENGTAYIYIY